MSLPAYGSYKPTGVAWLGDVPSHWHVKRLKTAASYRVSSVDKVPAEDEIPVRLCNYTDVYYNERICPDLPLMETTATAEEIQRFRLRPGDVLITKDSEDWSDIAIPALVEESADDLVCGYHLAIVRPDEKTLTGPFLLRAFQASAVNQQFQLASSGVTRFGLPKSAIGDALLPLPPLEEQRAIAAFLDAETAKLDRLIEKKRRLIELLAEQRSALISRTVTRGLPPDAARAAGLDPHPPMKDSGIEWLGDVPAHWEVGPIKRAIMFQRGHDLPADDRGNGDVPLVTSSGITATHSAAAAKAPGIVTGRYGTIGSFYLIKQDYWPLNTTLYSIDLHSNEPRFLTYMLMNLSPLFMVSAVKSAVPGVDRNDVHCELTAVPPASEQRLIADYLDIEVEAIDAMIDKVEQAIERLQEYRSALITAAVTGKIDVRATFEAS